MSTLLDKKVEISTDIAYRIIDGRAMIISSKSSNFFELNETATEIFQLIDKRKKLVIRKILEFVFSNYKIEPKKAEEDIIKMLQGLNKKGLINFK